MKVGEIWCYIGLTEYSIYDTPINPAKPYIESYDLKFNDTFTILEVTEKDKEYWTCILFNNNKWYLEVSKNPILRLFRKL